MKTLKSLLKASLLTMLIISYSCGLEEVSESERPNEFIGSAPPPVILDVKVDGISKDDMTVSWSTANGYGRTINGEPADLEEFVVEYSTNIDFSDSKIIYTKTNKVIITDLIPSTKYYVRVRSKNNNGIEGKNISPFSSLGEDDGASTEGIPALTSPSNFSVTPNDVSIKLEWDVPISGGASADGKTELKIKEYRITYYPTSDPTNVMTKVILANVTESSIDEGVNPETEYQVSLVAVNENDVLSDAVSEMIMTLDSDVKASLPVNDITIVKGSNDGELVISWSPPTNPGQIDSKTPAIVVSYIVKWSENNDDTNLFEAKDITETTYTVTAPKGSTRYYFRIFAVNNATSLGLQSVAAQMSFLTSSLATSPSVPVGFQKRSDDDLTQLVLEWTAVTAGLEDSGALASITKYVIEYSQDPSYASSELKDIVVASGDMPDTEYVFTNELLGNTRYYFRIKSRNSSGLESVYSPNLVITVGNRAQPPTAPTNLTVTPSTTNRSLAFNWTVPSDSGKELDGTTDASIEGYNFQIVADKDMPVTGANLLFENGWAGAANSYNLDYSSNIEANDLIGGNTYFVRILARNTGAAKSSYTGFESFTVTDLSTIPSQVTFGMIFVENQDGNQGEADVSWNLPGGGNNINGVRYSIKTISFEIEYTYVDSPTAIADFTDASRIKSETIVASDPPTSTYKFTGLRGSTKYFFRIRAINSNTTKNKGLFSEIKSFITGGQSTSPTAPRSLTSVENAQNGLTISFTASQSFGKSSNGVDDARITKYTLYYSTSENDSFFSAKSGSDGAIRKTVDLTIPSSGTIPPLSIKTDDNLPGGITLYYTIEANNSEGLLTQAAVISNTLGDRSTPPSSIKASNIVSIGNRSLTVTWLAPTGAALGKQADGITNATSIASYKVRAQRISGGTIKESSATNSTSINITGLDAYADYRVWVVAKNNANANYSTNPSSLTDSNSTVYRTKSEAVVSTVPSTVSLGTATENSIVISWTAPTNTGKNDDGSVGVINHYEIQYREGTTGDYIAFESTHLGFSATVTGLKGATDYQFQVRAVNTSPDTNQIGSWSVAETKKTLNAGVLPGAPSVTLGTATKNSIPISWTAPTNTGKNDDGSIGIINHYEIQYREGTTGGYIAFGSTHTGTSATVTGLKGATDYQFQVRAVNTTPDIDKKSSWSAVQSKSTLNAAEAPGVPATVTLGTATKSSVPISWTAPTNTGKNDDGSVGVINHYEIQYREGTTGGYTAFGSTHTGSSATVTGLKGATNYQFQVRAVNTTPVIDRKGSWSALQSKSTLSAAEVSDVPATVSLGTATENSVFISWTAPTNTGKNDDGSVATINHYEIQYREGMTGGYTAFESTHTGLSATVAGLKGATDYQFRVRAINSNPYLFASQALWSAAQTKKTLNAGVLPGAPSVTLGTATKNSIPISWTAPTNTGKNDDGSIGIINHYEIQYREGTTGGYIAFGSTHTGTSATVTGLKGATDYQFQVRAVNTTPDIDKKSSWSAVQSKSTLNAAEAPGVPATVTLGTATKSSVPISWTAPTNTGKNDDGSVGVINHYEIQYREGTTGGYTAFGSTHTGSSATVTGLKGATNYQFQVRAVNTTPVIDRKGSWSALQSKSTLSAAEVSDVPATVSLGTATENSVFISWTAPTNTGKNDDGSVATINHYEIQYREGMTGGYTAFESTHTGLSATVAGLKGATDYQFRVRAINSNPYLFASQALWSAAQTKKTLNAGVLPGAPSVTLGTATKNSIPISWTAPTNTGKNDDGSIGIINHYEIQYREGTTGGYIAFGSTHTGSSTTVTDLKGDTNYQFQVRAVNTTPDTKIGSWSVAETGKTLNAAEVPGAPSVTLGTATENSIVVNWTAPTNTGKNDDGSVGVINHYEIQYREGTTGGYTAFGSTHTGSSATVTGLKGDTDYQFQVRAVNTTPDTNQIGSWSVAETGKTLNAAEVPGAPSVSLGTATESSMPISWTAPTNTGKNDDGSVGVINHYEIQYREGTTGGYTAFGSTHTGSSATVTGLKGATNYQFQVRAVNTTPDTNQIGSWSVAETGKTLNAAEVPGAPSVSLGTATESSMPISWTAPTNTGKNDDGSVGVINHYEIQYREGTTGGYTAFGSTHTGSSATVTGLKGATDYQFQVRAVNTTPDTNQIGSWSVAETGKTLNAAEVPGAPSVSLGTATKSSMPISWTAPTNTGKNDDGSVGVINHYEIQYREGTTGEYTAFGSTHLGSSATVTGLKGDTDYQFQVRAVNTTTATNQIGSWSAVQSKSTSNAAEAPGAPSVNLGIAAKSSMPINWTAPTNTGKNDDGSVGVINHYEIQYREGTTGGYTAFGSTHTGSSATVTGLKGATNYQFQVRAVNTTPVIDQEGLWSVAETGKTLNAAEVPGAPSVSLGTATENSIAINWTAPTNTGKNDDGSVGVINHYEIQYREGTTGGYTAFGSTHTGSSATVTGLKGATNYQFQVRAVNTTPVIDKKGSWSAVQSKSTLNAAEVPGAPSVTLGTATKSSMPISWTAPTNTGKNDDGSVGIINHYEIQYREGTTGGYTAFGSTHTGSSATVTGLKGATNYQFQVRAVNTTPIIDKKGSWSAVQSKSTLNAAEVPGAPSVNLGTATKSSVVVNWTAPTNTGKNDDGSVGVINHYEIQYREGTTGGYTAFGSTHTGSSATVTGLKGATNYQFQVRAVNTTPVIDKKGSWSALQSKSTLNAAEVPGAPSVSLGTATKSSVPISWTAPTNTGKNDDGSVGVINHYEIQYREGTTGGYTAFGSTHTGSSTTVTGLKGATDYQFQVRAVNTTPVIDKKGSWSAVQSKKTLSAAEVPGIPSVSLGTATKSSVVVNWTAPTNTGKNDDGSVGVINHYEIQYREGTTGGYTAFGSTHTGSSATVTGLKGATNYQFQVRAVNTTPVIDKKGSWSAVQSKSTLSAAELPGIPSVSLGTATKNSIVVNWTAPTNTGKNDDGSVGIINHYRVRYRRGTTGGYTTGSTHTGFSRTVMGLKGNTDYQFQVRAENTTPGIDQVSSWSTALTKKTLSAAEAPGAPTEVKAIVASTSTEANTDRYHKVNVSWTAPTNKGKLDDGTNATNIDHYILWSRRKIDPVNNNIQDQHVVIDGNIAGTKTSIDISIGNIGDVAARTYSFIVQAVNSTLVNNTSPSSTASADYTMPDRVRSITVKINKAPTPTTTSDAVYRVYASNSGSDVEVLRGNFLTMGSESEQTKDFTYNAPESVTVTETILNSIYRMFSYNNSSANPVNWQNTVTLTYFSGLTITKTESNIADNTRSDLAFP